MLLPTKENSRKSILQQRARGHKRKVANGIQEASHEWPLKGSLIIKLRDRELSANGIKNMVIITQILSNYL